MKTFHISFSYSKDGKSWTFTSISVKAETDTGAIAQVESKYEYVRDIKIRSVN